MDIVLTHRRLCGKPDIGAGARLINPPRANNIYAVAIRESSDHVVSISKDRQVETRQVFDEGQGRGGGVDEDRIIRFDALCSEARDRGLFVAVHLFAFVERKFDPALVWADGPTVDAKQFTPLLKTLKIRADCFVSDLENSCQIRGSDGFRLQEFG